MDKTNSSGESTIYITLDPDNKIAESIAPQAELNNEYKNSLGTKDLSFSSRPQQLRPSIHINIQ
ncbi:MAG: hypothetical protein IPO33_18715 [Saprospiraceae bacterium]|nr:hypothetical protein [Candidatus Brachybacter algidus]